MTASPACLSRQVGDFLPPAGGLPFLSPADLAAAVPGGGRARLVACLTLPPLCPAGGLPSLSPPYPALSLLSCPLSPRPPSPAGKGETKSLFRRGLRPRHPCIRPFAALTVPAMRAPRARSLRCGAKPAETLSYEQCRQPRRGGTGGEELRRLRWSSPPGQGSKLTAGWGGDKAGTPPPGTAAANQAADQNKAAPLQRRLLSTEIPN